MKPLPTNDSKFWDGEKHSIDINEIKNLLCDLHTFELISTSRELKCVNCGLTTRFTPTTIDIDGDKVTYKNKKHNLLIKTNEEKSQDKA